jgi:transcription antitermination factor NusG
MLMVNQKLDEVPGLAGMVEQREPSDIELRYFVMLTEPNKELSAERRLINSGFDAYVPKETKIVNYGVRSFGTTAIRKREVTRPIFRGYLFLPLNIAWSFGPIHRCEGLRPNGRCFYVHNGKHVTLSARDIALLRYIEEALAQAVITGCEFKVGDKVRYAEGPLADIVLTIARLDDAERIELLSDLFKGSSTLFASARQLLPA